MTRRGWARPAALTILLIIALPGFAEDVTLRLKWLHGAQFAGYYAAAERGYYAEEGLNVTFIEGATDFEQFAAVVDGQFDFMVADALRVLEAPGRGIPVVAIAAIYQTDPLAIFSLEEAGIETPYDLVGKRVMTYGVMFPALLGKLGIPVSEITPVGLSYDVSILLDGEVDAWVGYVTNEAVRVRQAGHEIHIIHPADYGVDIYGDVLITSRRMVEEDPDLVTRFLRATLRGWEYVTLFPEESASFALRFNPQLDIAQQRGSLQASLPLLSSGRAPLGWMDEDRWHFAADTLRQYGSVDGPIEADQAFDVRFLEIIYEEEN